MRVVALAALAFAGAAIGSAAGAMMLTPVDKTWDGTVPEGNVVHMRGYAPENFKKGDAWVDNVGDGYVHKYYRFDGKRWHEVELVDGLPR